MEVFDGHQALFRPLSAPAVCLGMFDGVHFGHRRLFEATIEAANRLGGDAVVYTFEPHPARVLAPDLAPPLITSRDRKLELIAGAGIDVCILEPFTLELAKLAPTAFIDEILLRALGAREVVVGYDFTFGKDRAGTTTVLEQVGAQQGFGVQVIPQFTVDGLVASSTKIRDFALLGVLGGVRKLLGRDHDVDGEIIEGDRRGRTIGFPTANLSVDADILLPKSGVYAVRATLLETQETFDGVANLGTRPTFVEVGALSLEVYMFDFDRDVYGQRMRVSFVGRIRGERKFDGIDALVAQIKADSARARALLQGELS